MEGRAWTGEPCSRLHLCLRRFCSSGGNVWESNPPCAQRRNDGFEDREAHQHLFAPDRRVFYPFSRVSPGRRSNRRQIVAKWSTIGRHQENWRRPHVCKARVKTTRGNRPLDRKGARQAESATAGQRAPSTGLRMTFTRWVGRAVPRIHRVCPSHTNQLHHT